MHSLKRRATLISCFLVISGMAIPASAQPQAKRGAVVGGLSGAAIGAIIGDNSDEAGAGAAIGGAVGAIAGTILGQANQEQYGNLPRYNTVPQYRTPTYAVPQATPAYQSAPVVTNRAITVNDVMAMTQSRVSDTVIISEIQTKGVAATPSVQQIVLLSQQGVSDVVIQAMQVAGGPVNPVVVATAPARPVVVQRYPTTYRGYPVHRGYTVHRGYHAPTYPSRGPGCQRGYPATAYRPRSGVTISLGTR